MKNNANLFPQMQLICGKDDLRPLMQYVKIDKNFVVATDAHVLVYFKTKDLFTSDFIERLGDRSIMVHREDWKSLYDCELFEFESDNVLELFHAKKRNQMIKIEEEETIGKYPKLEAVIPSGDMEPEFTKIINIGIDPKKLSTVHKCFSDKFPLKVKIRARRTALLVESENNDCTGVGLIMPVLLNDENERINTGL